MKTKLGDSTTGSVSVDTQETSDSAVEQSAETGQWRHSEVEVVSDVSSQFSTQPGATSHSPDIPIAKRSAIPSHAAAEFDSSFSGQSEYLLTRHTSPETRSELLDTFVRSLNPQELVALCEHQKLTSQDVAEFRSLAGKQSKAGKLLLGGDKAGEKQKKDLVKGLGEAVSVQLLASLKGAEPAHFKSIFERAKVSEKSLRAFVSSVGMNGKSLAGLNNVPSSHASPPLPASLREGSLSVTIGVELPKAKGKARSLSPGEVSDFAHNPALLTLRKKQTGDPEADLSVKTLLAGDDRSLLNDANRMLFTLETCPKVTTDPARHTTVHFDSRLLPGRSGTSQASPEELDERKSHLESKFASVIDGSQEGMHVFRALVHQGLLNDLSLKVTPKLPLHPTCSSSKAAEGPSHVRFVSMPPDEMVVIATNEYDRFVHPSKLTRHDGQGTLRLEVKLVKKDGVWECKHMDASYRDNVNTSLVPEPKPKTPKPSRKLEVHKLRKAASDSQLLATGASNQPMKAVKYPDGRWLVASDEAHEFMQKVESKRPRVQTNLKITTDDWTRKLDVVEGRTDQALSSMRVGAEDHAKQYGYDLNEQKKRSALRQMLGEAAIDLQSSSLNAIRSNALNDSDDTVVSDDELAQLFASELKGFRKKRVEMRHRTHKAYEDYCDANPTPPDLDRSKFTDAQQGSLNRLVSLYQLSQEWHALQYRQLQAQMVMLEKVNSFAELLENLKSSDELESESKEKIKVFRERGYEGAEIKMNSLKPTPEQEMQLKILGEKTYIHQSAFQSQLQQFRELLHSKIDKLKPDWDLHVGSAETGDTQRESDQSGGGLAVGTTGASGYGRDSEDDYDHLPPVKKEPVLVKTNTEDGRRPRYNSGTKDSDLD